MRKIVIGGVVLGALLLAACDEKSSGSGEAPAQSASATAATVPAPSASAAEKKKEEKKAEGPKDHKLRLKAFEEAWDARDAKKIAALYAEDAVVKVPGHPDLKGRNEIEKRFEKNYAAFKDLKVTPGRVWEKDKHTIVVEWVASGTDTGEWPEMGIDKATNKPFGVVAASWLEIGDDGFVKEEHKYIDGPTLVKQVKDEKKEPFRALVMAAPDGHEHYGDKDMAGAESKEAKKDDKAEKKDDKAKKEEKKDDKADSAKMAEMEKKNVELEDKFLGFQNANKMDDAYKLMADGFVYTDYTQEKDVKGKPAFKEMVKGFMTAFPDMKVKSNNSFAAGDFVVEEFEYTGTQKGPLGPIKATNKPIDLHQLEVDEFKDGKFVRSWTWGNNNELYTELGLDKKEEKKEEKKEKHEKH